MNHATHPFHPHTQQFMTIYMEYLDLFFEIKKLIFDIYSHMKLLLIKTIILYIISYLILLFISLIEEEAINMRAFNRKRENI